MLTVAIDEDVKNFLSNFVDENAALLPGRIPGFKNEDIQLLSSNETKVHVWKCFTRACEESNKQAVCKCAIFGVMYKSHPSAGKLPG